MRLTYLILFQCLQIIVVSSLLMSSTLAKPINQSGELNIDPIHLDKGSIDDAVHSVIGDAQGFLWIGTDNGLLRYDGYELKPFRYDPEDPKSIGGNQAYELLVDSHKTLWVAGKKLSRYDAVTESFKVFDLFAQNSVWSITEDADGTLWIGGEGFGLIGFNTVTETVVQRLFTGSEDPLGMAAIRTIAKDNDPAFLWLTTGAGLYRFNRFTLSYQHFALPDKLEISEGVLLDAVMDEQGILWVATINGLVSLDPKTAQSKWYQRGDPKQGALSANFISKVYIDKSKRLWVATDKKGLHLYVPKTDDFIHYPSSMEGDKSLPPSTIFDVYENEHSVWLAFNIFGVRRVSSGAKKFRTLTNNQYDENSLAFNNVLGLLEAQDGNIYIATDGGGLDIYDPKNQSFKNFVHDPQDPQSLSNDSVIAVEEDVDGRIWLGTWDGGISIYDKHSGQFSRLTHDPNAPATKTLGNNNVFRIEAMPDGRMLISVWYQGLQIYDPASQTFESYFPNGVGHESGIVNTTIQDFLPEKQGRYWIAGNNGLELFDPSTGKSQSILSQQVDTINDIIEDQQGALWIASSTGLFRFEPSTHNLTHYGVEQGLSSEFVVSLEIDNSGRLWLGTRSGLVRFDPQNGETEKFDLGDGLTNLQFNRFSHLRTQSGAMYFGGIGGLNYFQPDIMPRNQHIPKVVFTDLELFQQSVVPSPEAIIQYPINEVRKVTLEYDQRDITFAFSALDFVAPNSNQYRYKLAPLEKNWITVDSSRRRARYTNLDPGTYLFSVMGSNNDNLWNNTPAQITLVVKPVWWSIWWVRAIFVVSAIMAILLILYLQSKRNERQQTLLNRLVNEKTHELAQVNRQVKELNADLETRVEKRTSELSIEVEERRIAEAKLFHMAFHDALTGLPNRSWLIQHLEKLVEMVQKQGKSFAFMFLDGDKFKQINDTHGHIMGDQVLIETARRLEHILPENYQAVRLGGDEFIVVVEGNVTETKIRVLGQAIVNGFETPLLVNNIEVHFRMSIGMVICDEQYTNPEQVLRDADMAMYRAKENGRGSSKLFDKKMRERSIEIMVLENDLINAIDNNQMFLLYQPIVELASLKLVGFEALLRWKHPEKGMIAPEKFIPIAEESGQMVRIGRWILKQACQQLYRWNLQVNMNTPITMSVNVSSKQVNGSHLATEIQDILNDTGLPATLLKLEFSESALMEETELMQVLLEKLDGLGVECSIDDFGTGYSSLAYLEKLPVKQLKIDQKFIEPLRMKEKDTATEVVRATISLAHTLGIKVVAEGVESKKQQNVLRTLQCDFAQGKCFAIPLSEEQALDYLRNEHTGI
ncbi:EAL domain-containing protein [Alteromonadaceae bacterium BrNp21-10]|nr:EAL domain-containing protein [Alteromonadaceae bacterium BrNp21-10]